MMPVAKSTAATAPWLDGTRIRGTQIADVYKGGRLAATLRRTGGGTEFRYLESYLANPGPAVATTLPLRAEPVQTSSGAVPPFFAGLLPEGRRLTLLQRAIKTSLDDEFSLLLAVGADSVGDVSVVQHGASLDEAVDITIPTVSKDLLFADLLVERGIVDPTALAGAQDKVSDQVISLPVKRKGARYLLKLDPAHYPNLVRNEAYFLNLARRARFPVARAEVIYDAAGQPGLLVERFDRVVDQHGVHRRAVEDALQLLGLYPAEKYHPSYEMVAEVLADTCAAPLVAMRELFRQICFSWLTGNGDLHAKNISVMMADSGEWRLTPAYDLPSTLPYRDFTAALTLDGTSSGWSRKRLLAFAKTIELPTKAATTVLTEVLAATESIAADWQDGAVEFPKPVIRDVVRSFRQRRRLVEDD